MENAKDIKFNLNGMKDIGELLRNPQYGVAAGSTNWELQANGFTPALRAKATFHLGEEVYTLERLLEAFPWNMK